MVREFTEEDRLREQNRLHEAWLRDRQYEKYAKKQMIDELRKLRKERKKFQQELRRTEEIQRKSILAFREAGLSDKEIAEMLDMSEDAVKQIV